MSKAVAVNINDSSEFHEAYISNLMKIVNNVWNAARNSTLRCNADVCVTFRHSFPSNFHHNYSSKVKCSFAKIFPPISLQKIVPNYPLIESSSRLDSVACLAEL